MNYWNLRQRDLLQCEKFHHWQPARRILTSLRAFSVLSPKETYPVILDSCSQFCLISLSYCRILRQIISYTHQKVCCIANSYSRKHPHAINKLPQIKHSWYSVPTKADSLGDQSRQFLSRRQTLLLNKLWLICRQRDWHTIYFC